MRTSFQTADGLLVVTATQDCAPIVEHTSQLRSAGAVGSSEMRHAATIPNVVIEAYCNDAGITFEEWMGNPEHAKRMLNDPALSAFRVWEGRA